MTMKLSNEVCSHHRRPGGTSGIELDAAKGGVWISGFSAGLVELSGPARQ
jgi:hypothetical protein